MAIASWPLTIPYAPDRARFARVEHHRPVIRTEVEDGPDLMRVQAQTRIKKMSVTLYLTDTEYATFENFVEVTLAQGTQHFTMSVPAIGSTFETRRVYLDGASWTDEPADHGLWQVAFTLCVFSTA